MPVSALLLLMRYILMHILMRICRRHILAVLCRSARMCDITNMQKQTFSSVLNDLNVST